MTALFLLLILSAARAWAAASDCVELPEQDETASFRFIPSEKHEQLALQIPEGTLINSVRVQRYAVFDMDDPVENGALYRWANGFHSVTREWVIRDQLLFKTGDVYNRARTEESERILRNLRFIFDATVRPWRWCGDRVDLEVITRDIWTFTPSISVNHSGGQSTYSLGFRDANFLGTGKQVLIEHESDEERTGNTIVYGDPALFGSRWQLRAAVTDNDDGYDRNLRLQRPFFSIYERWSAGANLEQQLLEETRWFRGDEESEFDHQREYYRVFGGRAMDADEGGRVRRWLFGYVNETNSFDFSDSDIPPARLPDDRDYSYPYIGFQSIEDEYTTVRNLNYLGRTEDIFVGESYQWALGWSDDSLGASRDQLVLEGTYANTLLVSERQWWQLDSGVTGYFSVDDDSFENLLWTTESRYHWRQAQRWALFSGIRVDYADGLTEDRQLTLGGENGLRGYDRNYQVGDRSFVFNLEQRYYSRWHPFRLLRVGAAAFLDVGRAWYADRDNGSNDGVLANVGFGVRLNSSRAEKGSVVHIDLAFPLVKDDNVDDMQVLVTVKDRF